eukprot:g47790.t1
MWNECPEEVVDTGTIPTFKRHSDRYVNREGLEGYGPVSLDHHSLPFCKFTLQKVFMYEHVTRLPTQILYSQLRNSRQGPGGHRKHFNDTLKASLVKCSIPTDSWESLAVDPPEWRRNLWEGIKHLQTCHWEKAEA